MARWLAVLAVLFDILAPLLVLLPRTRAADPRNCDLDPASSRPGLHQAEYQSRHSHLPGERRHRFDRDACLLCSRGPSLRRRPRTRRIADRQAGCIVKREARDVQLLGSITHDGCRKRVRTDAKLRPDQAGSSGLLAVFLVNAGSDGIAYRSAMKNAAHQPPHSARSVGQRNG
jgi:hypothetical protein